MKINLIVILCMTIVIIIAAIYTMAIFKYDFTSTFDYINKMNLMLQNSDIANLLNGNPIGNLPVINIQTNNSEIKRLNECANGPIFLGDASDEFVCKRICGSAGKLLNVTTDDEIFSNGFKLTEGAWCTVTRPNCNLNTTYVRATANSVDCQTKYPSLFGGETGNRLVACNNLKYFNVKNILWDNLTNSRVTPMTKIYKGEDELLADGSYRFTCKFNEDEQGNQYIEHISNRFHPMRNFCTKELYKANPNIKITKDGKCDCGNYEETRVRNKVENDLTTTCTSCYDYYDGDKKILSISTDCVTLNSVYTQLQTDVVCKPEKFINLGSLCEKIELKVMYDDGKFPLHPIEPISGALKGNRKDTSNIQF